MLHETAGRLVASEYGKASDILLGGGVLSPILIVFILVVQLLHETAGRPVANGQPQNMERPATYS